MRKGLAYSRALLGTKEKVPAPKNRSRELGFKIRQDEGFRILARRANVNEESRAGTADRT